MRPTRKQAPPPRNLGQARANCMAIIKSGINERQKSEYVAVSRATDTVTILTNNAKSYDSPLNHLPSQAGGPVQPAPQAQSTSITDQQAVLELANHLSDIAKDLGVTLFGSDAMGQFVAQNPTAFRQEMAESNGNPLSENDDAQTTNDSNSNADSEITTQVVQHLEKVMDKAGKRVYDISDKTEEEVLGPGNQLQGVDGLQHYLESVDPNIRQEMEDIKAKAIADGTFMKAPNGKASNLNEKQWLQVRTKAFKNWFGDWVNDPENASKAISEETLEPEIYYHTVSDDTSRKGNAFFNIFEKQSDNNALFYFTNSKMMSQSYNENHDDLLKAKLFVGLLTERLQKMGIKTERSPLEKLRNKIIKKAPLNEEYLDRLFNSEQWSAEDIDNAIKEIGHENAREVLFAIKRNIANIKENTEVTRAFFLNVRTPYTTDAKGSMYYGIPDRGLARHPRVLKAAENKANHAKLKERVAEEAVKRYNEAKAKNDPSIADIREYDDMKGHFMRTVIKHIEEYRYLFSEEELNAFRDEEAPYLETYKADSELAKLADPQTTVITTHEIDLIVREDGSYDGMFVKNVKDWGEITWKISLQGDYYQSGHVIAVKGSTQIKSATDNNGQFSPFNKDIRYAFGPSYSKSNPYHNAHKATKQQRQDLLRLVKQNKYDASGTDILSLSNNNETTLFLIDHSSHSLLLKNQQENREKGVETDLFGIRKKYNLSKLTGDDIREIARNIAGDYRGSEALIQHRLQELGITPRNLPGIDITTAIKRGIGDYGKVDAEARGTEQQTQQDGSGVDGRENQGLLSEFRTSRGEVYGFLDADGNIGLDYNIITAEHPIHEYTHLWDKVVQSRNPELWNRGVELMKQIPLWEEITNSSEYGQMWRSQGKADAELDNLIASEVHARLVGRNGGTILNDLAKQKGSKNIIGKLRQWLLDVWKNLAETFGAISKERLNNMTLEEFNMMTLRDFSNETDLAAGTPTQEFRTSQGELYGFVDSKGNIYVDEHKIKPEHLIHEYVHLWDRAVMKHNPALWKRGVTLMKRTSL